MARPKEGALMDPLISHQNTWSVEPILQKVGTAQAKQGNGRDSQSRKKSLEKGNCTLSKTKKGNKICTDTDYVISLA